MTVRTRIAPSPTGELHIGTLRTILYDYAWAKKNNGQFIVRIEDTDQNRLVAGATERILDDIAAYGMMWDEGPRVGGTNGPYVQSERLHVYTKYAKQLLEKGHAYYCFCTKEELDELRQKQQLAKAIPRYDRRCLKLNAEDVIQKLSEGRPHVVRQKLPDHRVVEFDDLVMGKIKINTDELDDTVLMKSDGYPTYHLAVVVDDYLMKISHVIRGSEWISSTPKHILLCESFGWPLPEYVHLPVILSPQGTGKMSKREGDVSARSFLNKGYLPEAVLNFLMLLGWSPKDDREFFTLEEFVEAFDVKDLNTSNPAFDINKLNHFNAHYIMQLTDKDLAERLQSFAPENANPDMLLKMAPLVKERLKTLDEFSGLAGFIFTEMSAPETGWKEMAREHLVAARQIAEESEWSTEDLNQKFLKAIEEKAWKTGHFFMNLRLAIAGQDVTPPITECLVILGKIQTQNRLDQALSQLKSNL